MVVSCEAKNGEHMLPSEAEERPRHSSPNIETVYVFDIMLLTTLKRYTGVLLLLCELFQSKSMHPLWRIALGFYRGGCGFHLESSIKLIPFEIRTLCSISVP